MASVDDKESSPPTTFEDLGIPQSERTTAQPVTTVFGQRRKWNSLSKLEVAFLVIALLSILSTMGLTLERIVDILMNHRAGTDDFTFALVLLMSTAFCVFYIINGVFGERAFELLVFIGGVLIVLGYSIINYTQVDPDVTRRTPKTVKLVRLILVSVFGPIDIIMGLIIAKQYFESGNLVFRTVGANLDLQRMCRNMNLYVSVLKFDLQLQLTLVILVLSNGTQLELTEILVLSIGIPYSIIYTVLGWLAVRFENKIMAYIFFLGSVAEPAYIIYKIIDLSANWQESKTNRELLIPITVICASWAALGIRIILMVTSIRAVRNFGLGLKEKAYGNTGILNRAESRDAGSYQSLD